MGRTVPTYRMTLESIVAEWGEFRRALRREDRELFDSVMNKARAHASAASFTASADPVDTLFLSILIEQEREIRRLRGCADGSSTPAQTTTGT
jgi:hypothetical protein